MWSCLVLGSKRRRNNTYSHVTDTSPAVVTEAVMGTGAILVECGCDTSDVHVEDNICN